MAGPPELSGPGSDAAEGGAGRTTIGYLLVRKPVDDRDKTAIALDERGADVGFVAASRAGFDTGDEHQHDV